MGGGRAAAGGRGVLAGTAGFLLTVGIPAALHSWGSASLAATQRHTSQAAISTVAAAGSQAATLAAAAQPGVSVFSGLEEPASITAGPDGAMWFTESFDTIGRIDMLGNVTTFRDSQIAIPSDITEGPDGALWFGGYGQIGRISTSGQVCEHRREGMAGRRASRSPRSRR